MTEPITVPASTIPPGKVKRGCVIVDSSKTWKTRVPDPNSKRRQPKVGRKGQRYMEQKPEALVKVVASVRANTGSTLATAAITGLNKETVEAILTRNPEDSATAEKSLSNKYLAAADALLVHGLNGIDRVSPAQAFMMSGIATDKYIGIRSKGNPTVAIQINIASALQVAARNLEILTQSDNSTSDALNKGDNGPVIEVEASQPATVQPGPGTTAGGGVIPSNE